MFKVHTKRAVRLSEDTELFRSYVVKELIAMDQHCK